MVTSNAIPARLFQYIENTVRGSSMAYIAIFTILTPISGTLTRVSLIITTKPVYIDVMNVSILRLNIPTNTFNIFNLYMINTNMTVNMDNTINLES